MIALVDVGTDDDVRRRAPDFDALRGLIDGACARLGLLTQDGRPSYRALGLRLGRSGAVIYGIVNKGAWPKYETLVALADVAGQPRSVWLGAGGFPPAALPPQVERIYADLRREWRGLDDAQRREVIRELAELDGDDPDL